MFHLFKKISSKNKAVFKILEPDIELTPSISECVKALDSAAIKYNKLSKGYITFPAKLFNGINMIVGLHYTSDIVNRIEIFRPLECYDMSDFDVYESYAEIHDAVTSCYGNPQIAKLKTETKFPYERWIIKNYHIDHSICDRFGLEEHLSVKFENL